MFQTSKCQYEITAGGKVVVPAEQLIPVAVSSLVCEPSLHPSHDIIRSHHVTIVMKERK